MFAYSPGCGLGGFSSSTFSSFFGGGFLLSFFAPFFAFYASYYLFFFYSYFFFYIQSNSVFVTNFLIVIESSQSWYSSPVCLIWRVSQIIASYLWDIVLSDLNTIVIPLLVLEAICPTLGINVKSSLIAHWNLTVSFALFFIEKLSLFSYFITQSPKFILSSYSRGRFSNRIS